MLQTADLRNPTYSFDYRKITNNSFLPRIWQIRRILTACIS
ncbi:hypothetical protein AQPE_2549 [Aquipluma nitroreducens]|uniref:Uncharacterized protein n=1 Tax=Aquipluma nitroreducens TaxID=2010828 RepID=A0A5K7SAB3_9BACT|nr:hypothetical protein AQPE_2549 [Aquipluma nitroreducens]